MNNPRSLIIRWCTALALLVLTALTAPAADRWFDGGTISIAPDGDGAPTYTSGTWNTSTNNWDQGAMPHTNWNNANLDTAIFGGTYSTGTKVITLGSSVTVNQIQVLMGNSAANDANRMDIGLAALDAVNAITFGGTYSTNFPALSYKSPEGRNNQLYAKITGTVSGGLVIGHGSNGTDPTSGRLFIANTNNDFVGNLVWISGNLSLPASNVLGNATNKVVLAGGSLFISGSSFTSTFTGRDIVVAADSGINVNAASGTCLLDFSNMVITGSANLNRYSANNTAGELRFTCDMSGYTGIVENRAMTGAGSMTIQTTATSAGGWMVSGGILKLNTTDDTHIANGVGKTNLLMNGGTVNMNGKSETINGLEGATGFVQNQLASTTSILTLGDAATTATYDGTLRDNGGILALTKIGAGTQTLTGTNSYTGPTTINGGTLALAQSAIFSSSSITVAASATLDVSLLYSLPFTLGSSQSLSGSGSVNGSVATSPGSIIAPGTSAGTLTFSNDLTLASATLNFDLSASPGTVGSGVNDLIQLNGGALNLIGTNGVVLVGSITNGTYTLIQGAAYISGDASNFRVANPGRSVTYTFDTTTTAGSVLLTVSGLPPAAPVSLVWLGTNGVNWDVATTVNWNNAGNADLFYPADSVIFNDSGATGTVSLIGTPQPGAVTVNNNALAYTLQGSGKISGATGLAKSGAGTLNLNTANDFTGAVTVSGGTLKVGSASALGSPAAGTTINPNGTLDINAINLSTEPVTLAGGTITNSSPTTQQNAFSTLTVTATSTIGGNGRWDVRGTAASPVAAFATINNGVTLTKADANLIYLGVDSAVTNNGLVTVNAGTLSIYNGRVAGSGAFTVNPAGTLGLENTTTNPLAITLNGGALSTATTSALQTGPVTLQSNSTVNATVATTITGAISDSGGSYGFTKSGAGTLTLTGTNTYSGNTVVSAGTLALGATGSISNTPDINIAAGVTFNSSAAGTFTLGSTQTLEGGGSSAASIIGVVSTTVGGGTINPGTLNGIGTLSFNTNLTLTGGQTLNFDLSSATTVGAGVNDLIQVTTNLTLSGTSTIVINGNPGSGTYCLMTNLNGNITGGVGTLTLSNRTHATLALDFSNPKRVGLIVTAGAPTNLVWKGDGTANVWDAGMAANWLNGATPSVFLGGDSVLFDGTGSNSPAISLTGLIWPASVTVSNVAKEYTFGGPGWITGTNGLIKDGAAKLTLVTNHTYTGVTAIRAGTLQLGAGGPSGSVAGSITNNGTLALYRSDAPTFANVISGTGGLTLLGTGISGQSSYTVSGANSFSGPINVNQARFQIGAVGNPGKTSGITITNGGQVFCTAAGPFTNAITLAGTGWLEGAGNLGVIRFSGATWSGPITLAANASLSAYGSSGTVSGIISGPYELELRSGTSPSSDLLTLTPASGANAYASTRVNNTAATADGNIVLSAGNANAFSPGPVTLAGASVTRLGILRLNGSSFTFASLSSDNAFARVQNNHASTVATLTVGTNNSSTTYSGSLDNGAAAALAFTKAGTGTLTLSGYNTHSGATTINAGRLALTGGGLPNTATITISSNGVFDVSGLTNTFALGASSAQTLAGRGPVVGSFATTNLAVVLPGGNTVGTLTFSNHLAMAGGNWTFDLTSSTNTGGGINDLVDVRGDLLLADGTTTYINVTPASTPVVGTYRLLTWQGTRTGFGFVTTGTLPGLNASVVVNDAGKSIDLVVTSVDAFKWTGLTDNEWEIFNVKTNWLSGGGSPATYTLSGKVFFDDSGSNTAINITSDPQPGSITVSNMSKSYTFSGSGISGAGLLVKKGSGTLTLANNTIYANNYSGGTVIEGGTLRVGDGTTDSSLPGSGNVQNDGTLAFNVTGATAQSTVVSGTGSVTKTGAGTLTLDTANTYSGATTISNGRVDISNSGALGTAAAGTTVSSGAELHVAGSLSVGDTLNLAGSGSGNGALVVETGTSTWSGDVTATADTLLAANLSGSSLNFQGAFNAGANALVFKPVNGAYFTLSSNLTAGSVLVDEAGGIRLGGANPSLTNIALVKANPTSGSISATAGITALNSLALGTNCSVTLSNANLIGNSGAILRLGNNVNIPSGVSLNIILPGTGDAGGGNYRATFGGIGTSSTNVWNGPITVHGADPVTGQTSYLALRADSNSRITINGDLTLADGDATLAPRGDSSTYVINGKVNWGTNIVGALADAGVTDLYINSTSNIWRELQLAAARTHLGVNNALPTNAPVTMNNASGGLYLDGFSQRVGGLYGSAGTVRNDSTNTDSTLIVSSALSSNWVYAGSLANVAGAKTLSLDVGGTDPLTLTGNANNYTGSTTIRSGATLALTGSGNVSASTPMDVQAGGTFDVTGTTSGAFTLTTGRTLMGRGTINGSVSNAPGSILSPGESLGVLTVTSNLIIAGNLFIEVNKALSPSNDVISVGGAITNLGVGTLTVSNLNNAAPLASGNKFILFGGKPVVGGNLLTVTGGLGSGLGWTNKLAVDGSIAVVQAVATNPTNIVFSVSGGNQLTLTWPADHTGWKLQTQTNSLSVGLTGIWFDVSGSTATNQMTFTVSPAQPTVFYRLALP